MLRAKLQVPFLRSNLVTRPRLTNHLRLSLAHKLTLVSAPAGYGKTTLLASFAAGVDVPLVWYTLDDSDNDWATFVDYLLTGVNLARGASFGAPVRALLDDPEAVVQTEWLATVLLNELEREKLGSCNGDKGHSRTLLIILDDYHVITSQNVHAALNFLLSHLPPHIHLVIGSREDPPLSLAQLRAHGQLLEMRTSDLRFTLDETIQFLEKAKASMGDLSHAVALSLHEKMGGWAAGLQLAIKASSLDTQPSASTFIFDYLAEEVYADQPPYLQSFLARSAILDTLSADLCDYVLGIDNSRDLLETLMKANLFLFPQDASHTTYRYHDLFQEFLRRHLLEDMGKKTARDLYRKAGAWYLEHGDDEQAIQYLLEAKDYDAAAELIRPLQNRLFRTSRYHLLESWLEQFPSSTKSSKQPIQEKYPWLFLAQAKLSKIRGDRGMARSIYRQAEPFLKAQKDSAGLYTLYHDLAAIARAQRGDFTAAETLERQALAHASTPEERAVSLGWIARCLHIIHGPEDESEDRKSLGEFSPDRLRAKPLDVLEQAMDLVRKSDHSSRATNSSLSRTPSAVLASLFLLRGQIHGGIGDLKAALDDFHQALGLLEAEGNQHRQISIICDAAYHHYLLGQLDQAETLVQRAIKLAETFQREAHYAYATNLRGVLHSARGEWAAARRDHLEALSIQQRLGEKYEIGVTLNWLGLLHRREGRLEEALSWGEKGLRLREKLGNDYETGLSLIDVGATYLALGNLEQADSKWQRALEIFTRHRARYEQTQLHFYLAVLAYKRGTQWEGHLEQAMNLARSYEHVDDACSPRLRSGQAQDSPRCLYFFVADAVWTAPLMAAALQEGMDESSSVTHCAQCLLGRLGKPALQALLPLLDENSSETRIYAARLLGRLGDTAALKPLYKHRNDPHKHVRQAIERAQEMLLNTPPPPLRVQTLGNFQLWRGEHEITDWPRRSACDVFLLLLLRQPQPVASEALAEALWPGSSPDKAAQNLRRAISDLRRTLEPELPPRVPSRYLVVSDKTYALNLPLGSHVDDVEFEQKITRALQNASRFQSPQECQRAIAELKSALDLYTGDYLAEVPFEDWVLTRREFLRHQLLRGTRRLAQLHLDTGQFEEAITAAHCTLAQESWDEEATLILMQAYTAGSVLGNVPAALRAYETLRQRLAQDLDIPPRDDLTALYNRLREQRMLNGEC